MLTKSFVNRTFVYYLWIHKLHFSAIFSLKIGLTILLTHLKIILLQCFQFSVFNFSKISYIQTELNYVKKNMGEKWRAGGWCQQKQPGLIVVVSKTNKPNIVGTIHLSFYPIPTCSTTHSKKWPIPEDPLVLLTEPWQSSSMSIWALLLQPLLQTHLSSNNWTRFYNSQDRALTWALNTMLVI